MIHFSLLPLFGFIWITTALWAHYKIKNVPDKIPLSIEIIDHFIPIMWFVLLALYGKKVYKPYAARFFGLGLLLLSVSYSLSGLKQEIAGKTPLDLSTFESRKYTNNNRAYLGKHIKLYSLVWFELLYNYKKNTKDGTFQDLFDKQLYLNSLKHDDYTNEIIYPIVSLNNQEYINFKKLLLRFDDYKDIPKKYLPEKPFIKTLVFKTIHQYPSSLPREDKIHDEMLGDVVMDYHKDKIKKFIAKYPQLVSKNYNVLIQRKIETSLFGAVATAIIAFVLLVLGIRLYFIGHKYEKNQGNRY